MHHLTAAWGRQASSLSLEAAISVSEQAMERGGLAGKTVIVPSGRQDDPAYEAAIAPLTAYVRRVTGKPYLRCYTSEYTLQEHGNPQAVTDGMNWICLRPVTNEMTILHECAHVICSTSEGEGHSVRFAGVARDLYAEHISPAAAEQFWKILSLGSFV